jgi:NAD+ synthase (glutamine-hydrolysing)
MTKNITIATASLHTFAHDVTHNVGLIKRLIDEASKKNVALLLLPELCLSGYGVEDLFFSDEYVTDLLSKLSDISAILPKDMLVVCGLPVLLDGQRYNGAALLQQNNILGIVLKQHLALSGIHYEPRWFRPWPAGKKTTLDVCGEKVPVGDLFFDIDGIKCGFEICEDAWVKDRPAVSHHQKGVDIILNPSASHFAIGKQVVRQKLVVDASKQFDCLYLYSNLMGCETGRAIYDGANMIANRGKLLMQGRSFSFQETQMDVCTVTVTPHKSAVDSSQYDIAPFSWPDHKKEPTTHLNESLLSDNHDACMALARGLWDWQQKTKTTGYVVSLSGGADSGLCASLVYLSHWLAYETLGKEAYLFALKACGLDIALLQDKKDCLASVMPYVLTTVYQGSVNSSKQTTEAAFQLAKGLGASHEKWSIDEMVNDYVMRAEKKYQRKLNFETDDIALQNIQARARAPGVWLLANIENKLLLATSNLSEAVVGYCTMDGDTAGVLSPIGGVSKTRVLALNRFLMQEGIHFQGKHFCIPALSHIVKQTPTAELRPGESQTDEKDLMPYEVLDAIRVFAQVDFLSEETILSRLKERSFSKDYGVAQLTTWRDRYFSLYYRNQWKRERLAPSFHIEVDSACPKTYRRFPII